MSEAADRKINPIRETTDEAREMGRGLIKDARFGAIAVIDPEHQVPMTYRIAVSTTTGGAVMSLMSELSHHTLALAKNPVCSLMVGEPGPKGDPLNHPRVSLRCTARFVMRDDPEFPDLRDRQLETHPKSKLYIDFLDFRFAVFDVAEAHLNGGFGQSYVLTPEDLALT